MGRKRPPNILLTIADDQRFDAIHALGNPDILTPNLNRMVRDGTTFTRTYCMGSTHAAVCAPSRGMLHTGRTLFHQTDALTQPVEKLDGQTSDEREIPLETLGQLLGGRGYSTFATGKWHNRKPAFARSFKNAAKVFFGGMSEHDEVPVFDFDLSGEYTDDQKTIGDKFSTDLFADAAIEFLKNQRGDEPFFLYVAFTAPHDPRTPPQEFADLYDPEQIPLPENYLPEHPFDNGEMRVRDENLASWPRTPEVIRQHIADYYGMVTHMDAAIGRIHDTLREIGQVEDTILIHTADHGLAVGQHGLMGKQNMYEHSMRVPLLMCGPRIPKDQRLDALCYMHDLFPTLLEAAEITAPEGNEFKSLWPLLTGGTTTHWKSIFSTYKNCQRMVRDNRYKLIEYDVGGSRRAQLFDLKEAPWETRDLSDNPDYSDHKSHLRELLVQWEHQVDHPLLNDS